ncbi:MAG: hypothetical protein RIQ52_770 [Pseudomonadota bacterium]
MDWHTWYADMTFLWNLRALTRSGVPTGIRTPVAAVKGRCPRPLDDGDKDVTKIILRLGGAKEDRTPDLYNAIVALSQLSYGPLPK